MDKLVSDTITFGLKPDEGLEYIKREFESISKRTYFRRRAKLSSEESHMLWLSFFSRIGFVQLHKEQMDILQSIQEHSMKRFYQETQEEKPNDNLLLKLSADIRANALLLSEYSLGTPIIAAGKARMDKFQSKGNPDYANTIDFYWKNHYSGKV